MNAPFVDHPRVLVGTDIGLDHHAAGKAQNARDAGLPVTDPAEPEEVGGQRIGLPRQFAVLFPVGGVLMVGEMLDLV